MVIPKIPRTTAMNVRGDKIGETLPTESVPPQSHGGLQMTSRKPSGRDSVVCVPAF